VPLQQLNYGFAKHKLCPFTYNFANRAGNYCAHRLAASVGRLCVLQKSGQQIFLLSA
jgi:hypothetical protein